MYALLALSFRYFFLLYLLLFFFVGDKGQKVLICLTHITAFSVLVYKNGTADTLLIALAGLIFIIAAFFALRVFYKKALPKLWNSMFFLIDIGIIMLTRLNPPEALKQLALIFVGLAVMLLIPAVLALFKKYELLEILYLVLATALIASPFLFGREAYGAVNWVSLGSFSFQPSEPAKLVFIFYLAAALRNEAGLKKIFFAGAVSASLVLMLVLQRDLGGALIFFLVFTLILYVSTGRLLIVLSAFAAAGAAAAVAAARFQHIGVRINGWLHTWDYIDSDGYQIALGLFSIGTYGLFGSGLTLGYPEFNSVVERDMIFAAVCEEFGSLYGLLVILLYVYIFYHGIKISLAAKSKFLSLLSLGLSAMLSFQAFLIIAGIVRLLPLTGVTLPLVSYGGTSVIVSIFMIAVLQWVQIKNEQSVKEEIEEAHKEEKEEETYL